MNKLRKQISKRALQVTLVCFSLLLQTSLFAQNGKDLFKANCAACHSVGTNKMVGPGLGDIDSRRERAWLIDWTKDSQAMVKAGDADAVAIFEEYKIPMQGFAGTLSDEEINVIFDYVADPEGYAAAGAEEAVVEEAAAGDNELALQGQKVFKANCKACHSVGANKVVGPGLEGINDKYDEEWLIKWIQNSKELIDAGDADAVAIFNEYNSLPMPAQAISVDEVKAVLAYIQTPTDKKKETKEEVVADAGAEEGMSPMVFVLVGFILVMVVVVFLVNKSRVSIAKLVAEKEGRVYNGPVSLPEACQHLFKNNGKMVAFFVVIGIFAGLVVLMDGAFTIGVHQGYKPEQPIKFSHKVHAGDNKIDCNYCHSSARHSKTSGIPSLNVCMNCHKFIDGSDGKTFMYNGEEFSMEDEIKKIHTALDYDASTQEYGDNPQPVKWIKVHNLPDHVYYSHAQHVTAGKQKCQTCHGPVEEMDVLEQHSELTMKWCIECHQETSVVTEGNGYYEDMHSRMTDEYKEKVLGDGKLTVEEIGGWECAKCHY